MRPNDTEETVPFEELTCRRVPVKVALSSQRRGRGPQLVRGARKERDRERKGKEEENARKEVGATADMVVHKAFVVLLVAKLFERVGPQDVAHQSVRRRLAETVDLEFGGGRGVPNELKQLETARGRGGQTHGAQVVEGVEFGRQAAVDAQELLVHDSCERQSAE